MNFSTSQRRIINTRLRRCSQCFNRTIKYNKKQTPIICVNIRREGLKLFVRSNILIYLKWSLIYKHSNAVNYNNIRKYLNYLSSNMLGKILWNWDSLILGRHKLKLSWRILNPIKARGGGSHPPSSSRLVTHNLIEYNEAKHSF